MARRVSAHAQERLAADRELAERLPELLDQVRRADGVLRDAQSTRTTLTEQRKLATDLDEVLTDAMRAAYARRGIEIGPRGYDDRIYRRARMAKPAVKRWTREAERLLTYREEHRLTGVPRVPLKHAS